MAGINFPQIVRRVANVLNMDDSSDLDTILTIGALVLVAAHFTGVVTAILPILTPVALPVTTGLLAVVVRRLS